DGEHEGAEGMLGIGTTTQHERITGCSLVFNSLCVTYPQGGFAAALWRRRDGRPGRSCDRPAGACPPERGARQDAMLHVNDLTYRLGARVILDGATAALPPNARIGLVGRNGAGKTTLFRILLGEIAPESGSISIPRNLRIGAVAQEAPGGPERLIDVVLAADKERTALLAEAETTGDPMRRAEIETRLVDIDAHSA